MNLLFALTDGVELEWSFIRLYITRLKLCKAIRVEFLWGS